MTSHDLPIEEVRRILKEDRRKIACGLTGHSPVAYFDGFPETWKVRCSRCHKILLCNEQPPH